MWRRKRRQIFGEGKGGKYWENENIWSEEEIQNGEGRGGNILRRKIFGQRGRKMEKGKEENILEKESDDAQTDRQYIPTL